MAIISSHTLNGADGTHAGGIAVRVVNLSSGRELFSCAMDPGGRLLQHVDLQDCDRDDRYEMTFMTAEYWAGRGVAHDRLLDEIVLRFAMPDPDARYHMPIILSPNSYSCWSSLAESQDV